MEPDVTSANVILKPPPLNSDQLNYLIWRYLQEAGYAEAAVKLQRDWKVDTETLPFARHIKGQALVSLVQKGLRYHHLSLTVDENGQQTKQLAPSMFFFGPESADAESFTAEKEPLIKGNDANRGVSPASTIAQATKVKSRDATSAAPEDVSQNAAKRGRKPTQGLSADRNGITVRKVSGNTDAELVNGNFHSLGDLTSPFLADITVEDGTLTNGALEDRMDIDNDVADINEAVMEEQRDEPIPVLVPTLTTGKSVEIQVTPAEVSDLGSSSAILMLPATQTISRASWRPADVATLSVQGDTFCGVWNLTGHNLLPDSVKPPLQNLFPSSEVGFVTATAWNPDGTLLAVATCSEHEGQIHLFDGQNLELMESLPSSQRVVSMLRWHPSDAQLIGVAPSDGEVLHANAASSSILLWDFAPDTNAPIRSLALPSTVFDVDCAKGAGTSDIYIAGDNAVYRCNTSASMTIEQRWISENPNNKEIWNFLRCVQVHGSEVMAIAAASDSACLWIPNKGTIKENAHRAPITGLELKPSKHRLNGTYQALEFATSSLDGTIKVWESSENYSSLFCVHQLNFDPATSIMSLAYSPDAFCLAGATYDTVRVWNAQHSYNLMASWRGDGAAWRGSSIKDDDLGSAGGRSSVNGDGTPNSSDHSLTWHVDSKRLAFGLGSQVAVMNFQR